ncbi:MAG: ABC transporter substrate-binding protein [Coriobacteriaceae bacterium]|jgi:iron complex transport system substrate-binding protein|nr:ABC transporter substrate-binding protein [Coriobacteriaceae bacterium]
MRNSFKKIALCALTCLLGAALAVTTACSQTGPQEVGQPSREGGATGLDTPASHTFTDDLGREVTVGNPQRVVACMGSFANTWELAGGTLVGASDDALSDYTLTSRDVAKIGDFSAPNLEQIIALDPDFVIMTGASTGRDGAAGQTALKDGLEASGIKVAYFTVTTFEDYLRMLRICCDITGRDDLYQKNGAEVKQRIDEVKAKAALASKAAPKVLLMTTYSGGTRVQNSSTMTGTMLAELGATNLADQQASLLKDFSLEAVIDLDPEFILVVPMGNDDEAALKNLKSATEANPAWAGLDAVKQGNYLTLDKGLFLYKPNAQWDKSYQALYDILYS